MTTVIDGLVGYHRALTKYLDDQGQISLRAEADAQFRKALLLSAASYFETQIKDGIVAFASEHASTAEPLLEFVKNKAIERQYHTFFSWNSNNANAFFGLFGSDFKSFMISKGGANSALSTSIKRFLELGNLRNQLVHQDFAAFALDKTVDEIYELYRAGLMFVEEFPGYLREYCSQGRAAARESPL